MSRSRAFYRPGAVLHVSTSSALGSDRRRVTMAALRDFFTGSQLAVLRTFLADLPDLGTRASLDDDRLVAALVDLIERGRLHAHIEALPPPMALHGSSSEAEDVAPAREPDWPKSWIEIELIDMADAPVPGARYVVECVDGSVREGRLDSTGLAHVGGIDPGTCKITFPDLDADAWERA